MAAETSLPFKRILLTENPLSLYLTPSPKAKLSLSLISPDFSTIPNGTPAFLGELKLIISLPVLPFKYALVKPLLLNN